MTEPATPQLTEEAVREIEARTNAATKGDWTIRGGHWIDDGVKCAGYGIRFTDSPFGERYGGWDARTNFPPETPEGAQAGADRALLAHARVDIDALTRDWRAMRKCLDDALVRAAEDQDYDSEQRAVLVKEHDELQSQLAQVTSERDEARRELQAETERQAGADL